MTPKFKIGEKVLVKNLKYGEIYESLMATYIYERDYSNHIFRIDKYYLVETASKELVIRYTLKSLGCIPKIDLRLRYSLFAENMLEKIVDNTVNIF